MTQEVDVPEGENVDPRETKRVVEEVTPAAPVEQTVERRTEEVRTETSPTTTTTTPPNPDNR